MVKKLEEMLKSVYRKAEEDGRTYSPKSDCYDRSIEAYGDMSLKEGRREGNKGLTL